MDSVDSVNGGGSVEAAYGATTEEENPLEEELGLVGLATPERAQALKLGTSSENSPLSLEFWKARAPPDLKCARCGDLQGEVDAALAATRRAEVAKQAAEANLELEVDAALAATRRAEVAKQAAEAHLQAYKEWATHELRDMAEKNNRREGESLKANTKELTAQNHELKDLLDRLMDTLEKERDTGATEAKALVQATERLKTQEAMLAALAKRIKAQESELSARKAEAGLRSTPVPAPHLSTGAALPVSNVTTGVDLGRLTALPTGAATVNNQAAANALLAAKETKESAPCAGGAGQMDDRGDKASAKASAAGEDDEEVAGKTAGQLQIGVAVRKESGVLEAKRGAKQKTQGGGGDGEGSRPAAQEAATKTRQVSAVKMSGMVGEASEEAGERAEWNLGANNRTAEAEESSRGEHGGSERHSSAEYARYCELAFRNDLLLRRRVRRWWQWKLRRQKLRGGRAPGSGRHWRPFGVAN